MPRTQLLAMFVKIQHGLQAGACRHAGQQLLFLALDRLGNWKQLCPLLGGRYQNPIVIAKQNISGMHRHPTAVDRNLGGKQVLCGTRPTIDRTRVVG